MADVIELDSEPLPERFRNGDSVYYRDPDRGIASDWYVIIEKVEDDGENSVYLLSNGRFNLEAYQCDLSYG